MSLLLLYIMQERPKCPKTISYIYKFHLSKMMAVWYIIGGALPVMSCPERCNYPYRRGANEGASGHSYCRRFPFALLPGCPSGVPVWPPNIPSDQTLPCGSTWHCFLAFSIQIEFTTSLSSATSGKIKKTRRDAKKAMQLPTWRSWHWHVQMLGGGFTFGELSSFNVLAVLAEPDGLTVVNGDNGAQFASPVRRFGPSPRLCDNVCMSVSCVANGHPYWAFNAILE